MDEVLTDQNFVLYAAKRYQNPQVTTTDEFIDDLKILKYVKKLLTSYRKSGELRERLILNHLIVLNNVFGAEATCRLVFLRLRDYLPQVKPFLLQVGILPDRIKNVGTNGVVESASIQSDPVVEAALRSL